jgi:hypothetical protein
LQLKIELIRFLTELNIKVLDEFELPPFQVFGVRRPLNSVGLLYKKQGVAEFSDTPVASH